MYALTIPHRALRDDKIAQENLTDIDYGEYLIVSCYSVAHDFMQIFVKILRFYVLIKCSKKSL